MDRILDTMCVDVNHYQICDHELYDLFNGEDVIAHDGHHFSTHFSSPYHDTNSALCREHEGMEFCLDNIVDLYEPTHDCIKYADEWIC